MPIDRDEVRRYIRQDIKNIHTEQDVARHFDKSVETLRKDFARNGEVSLSDFISDARLETMVRLLVETDLPCKAICFEAGFRREDSGSKFFKRITGMTMREYRKKTLPNLISKLKTQNSKLKTQNKSTQPFW